MEKQTRTIEFPCGYRFRTSISEDYGAGDRIKVEFSTRRCVDHSRDCENPDGHLKQRRLGTKSFPHVEMACPGKVSIEPKKDLELRFVYTKARKAWGDKVSDVFQIEPSVFEVVNGSMECVGYVLKHGASSEYLRCGKPWIFFKL